MDRQLEVGDELVPFSSNFYNRNYRPAITIERVTKTQAISGDYRFKRELSNNYRGEDSLYAMGIGKVNTRSFTYYLKTPQLELEMAEMDAARELSFRVARLEDKLTRKLLAKLTTEELDIVEAIADKYNN